MLTKSLPNSQFEKIMRNAWNSIYQLSGSVENGVL